MRHAFIRDLPENRLAPARPWPTCALTLLLVLAMTGGARASIIAHGSRICDTDRVALAAKDADYTLASNGQIIIYAGGVNGNDSKLENDTPHVWKFRRVGGSWADITTSSEVKLIDSAALSHGTNVAIASRRATQGDPDIYVIAGRELETSGSLNIASGVAGGQITESQVALSFADAPDDQQYEFACEWDNDQSPLIIAYTAKITTAGTGNAAPTDLIIVSTSAGGLNLNADGGNDVYLLAGDGDAIFGGLTSITLEVQFTSTIIPPDLGDSDFLSYGVTGVQSANNIWFGVYRNDGGDGYALGLGVDGAYRYATGYDASALFDGVFHTVSATWDNASGDYEFFVDGISRNSGSNFKTGHTVPGGGEMVVGMEQDEGGGGFQSNQVFQGTMYDIRIFDDVRTSGEIASGHGVTLPPGESGLLANWACSDLSSGGVVSDAVGGNHLTVQHASGPGFVSSTPSLTMAVREDAADATVIARAEASDPDAGESFTYSLIDDAGGRFAIDGPSGQITLANSLLIDYDDAASHTITIEVHDSGDLNYNEIFTINVLNVIEISGLVFEDTDFAGTATGWDGGTGDMALPNVDVELYNNSDTYLASTTTAGDGTYTFTGLTDGTYKIRARSATIGDADTPPAGGLHPTVPATWPYPLPEMLWGHGAALIGGQNHTVDDTITGDNAGPSDTYVMVTVSGADVTGVNFGFNYELIVNEDDDSNADSVRSKQGTLRQFIKNSNAIAGMNKSWFQIP